MRLTESELLHYIATKLIYVPSEGRFYRKTKEGLKPAGYSAIRNKPYGRPYATLNIYKSQYLVHRLVFLFENGHLPKGEIDHIDGDTLNNRIANLRDVTNVQNRRNQKRHSRNTSGHTGVYWNKSIKRWEAQIGNNGKLVYLGCFKTYEEAVERRLLAEQQYAYSPTHGKR